VKFENCRLSRRITFIALVTYSFFKILVIERICQFFLNFDLIPSSTHACNFWIFALFVSLKRCEKAIFRISKFMIFHAFGVVVKTGQFQLRCLFKFLSKTRWIHLQRTFLKRGIEPSIFSLKYRRKIVSNDMASADNVAIENHPDSDAWVSLFHQFDSYKIQVISKISGIN